MPTNVVMPQLGESVTEGTITRWLKNVGDVIKVDEAIVEVSTDKVDTEIPSPVAGVLVEIKAAQDSVIPVGGVMAVIGESVSASAPTPAPAAPVAQTPPPAPKIEPVVEKPTLQTPPPAPVASNGSTVNILLPQLGESVTEGTITRWLKNVGDSVSIDEAIVEISTDKVDTEIPSPVAGIISEIKVSQDQIAAVGAVIAVISTNSSSHNSNPAPTAVAPVLQIPTPAPKSEPINSQVVTTPAQVATVFATTPTQSKDAYSTPIVRKLAKEKGIDLSTISGTGVNGRIKKEDLDRTSVTINASPQVAAAPAIHDADAKQNIPKSAGAVTEQPLQGKVEQTTRLRRVIAEEWSNHFTSLHN